MSTTEKWRPIRNHPEYEVSNLGRFKRVVPTKSNKSVPYFVHPRPSSNGYLTITLWNGDGQVSKYAHRCVAEAFIGTPQNNMDCEHLDGSRTNNNVENLRWATRKENNIRKISHGTISRGNGTYNHKLVDSDIPTIRVLHKLGFSGDQIGQLFFVTGATIRCVIRGETWKHIN